jgi:hypothetical protein
MGMAKDSMRGGTRIAILGTAPGLSRANDWLRRTSAIFAEYVYSQRPAGHVHPHIAR